MVNQLRHLLAEQLLVFNICQQKYQKIKVVNLIAVTELFTYFLCWPLWSLVIMSEFFYLFLNTGSKSCCSHCLCYWNTFYWWCNENDSIWGCRCYGDWRHRVQHWCIINCRVLQVNYDQHLVLYVVVNHLISSLSFFPLILKTCRSRALSTKYNSSPLEASRPFDSGRDGFVWVYADLFLIMIIHLFFLMFIF